MPSPQFLALRTLWFRSAAAPPSNPTFSVAPIGVYTSDLDVSLMALGADSQDSESALLYTWSKVSGPGTVIFADNGTNTAKQTTATVSTSGNYVFRCAVVNTRGGTVSADTATVTVPGGDGPADFIVTNDAQWTSAIAAATSGKVIEVQGGNFLSRKSLTGTYSPPLVIRGQDANAELPFGIQFTGTTNGVTFKNIKLSRQQPAEGSFWSPLAVTIEGLIVAGSSATIANLRMEGCVLDGGLDAFAEGGRMVANTSARFSLINGLVVTGCTIQRCVTAFYINSCNGVVIENCDISGQHADTFALENSSAHCENVIIRNNHVYNLAGDAGYFHMDFCQIQPQDNDFEVRNIQIYGNTYSFGDAPFIAQADKKGPATYNVYTSDLTVPESEHAQETRLAPSGGGSMVVTMPSAATSLRQFCFRQTGAGTVTFALDGADTWIGGTPSVNAAGQWVTFVSDGTSQWKKLSPGFRTWYILVTQSRVLVDTDDGNIVTIDASAGNVDIILPEGYNTVYGFTVRRIDNSSNTVRLLLEGADTLTVDGISRVEVNYVLGYSLDIIGIGGVWTAAEDKPTNQINYSNQHPRQLYSNIEVFGNIHFNTAGVAFNIEQEADGIRVYNNTYLQLLTEDQNGDGIIGPFEGNSGRTMNIDIRGDDAQSWANYTVGGILTAEGDSDAQDIGSITLLAGNTIGLEDTYAVYTNGTTRADYRPLTRDEVIDAALAKPSGPLDGTYIGAVGTTRTNGFYNFDTGEVNTVDLPVPVISDSIPAQAGSVGVDGVLTITFSQFVHAGTGNILLRNKTLDTVLETFDAATGVGSNGGTVSFFNRVLTIDPMNDLPDGDECSVWVDATAVLGHYNTPFVGISNDTGYYFTADASIPTSFQVVAGSGARLNRTIMSGISGTKQKVLFGVNFNRDPGSDSLGALLYLDGPRDFGVTTTSTGELRFNVGGSSFRIPAATPSGPLGTILLSVDLSAATIALGVKLYKDGVFIPTTTFTSVTWVPGTDISYATNVSGTVMDNPFSQTLWGDVGFVYFDHPSVLPDLDDSAIRALFTLGQIGSGGTGPTTLQPFIYVTGPAADWNAGVNHGYGGAFTATGTFVDV